MSTQSQYHVTVAIDGSPIGVFDSRSGGETTSEIAKRNTGEGTKVYKGRKTDGDITVVRGYERERDHELVRHLRTRVGKADMVVTEQPLDDEGNAWGAPTVSTGVLSGVNGGDVDADSDDPRDLELTMTTKATS